MYNWMRAVVATAAIATVGTAGAVTLDFDMDSGGNPIVAGQIIDNEYAGFGVTISALNLGGGPDLAVAFDSANPPPASGDPDLITPGYGPNNNTAYNNVLILQENGGDFNNDGFLDGVTDDEAGGGFIDFMFTSDQLFAKLDILDIEEGGGSVQLFKDNLLQAVMPILNAGDNSLQTVLFNSGVAFDKIRVHLIGSGAVAEVVVGVPEPGTWLLMGTMLGAVMFVAHRRRIQA